MATFLEVAQTVDKVLGTQGDVTSIASPDYHVLLAEHIRDSWISIQNLRTEWKFMRDSVIFNTVIGQDEYTIANIFSAVDNVRKWKKNSIIYERDPLIYNPYDRYILEDWTTSPSKPNRFSINEQNNSLYINRPDNVYFITAHYYKKPQVLLANTDIVQIPTEYLYALVYKSCASLGIYLGISEIFQNYSQLANQELRAMMRGQNPAKKVRVRSLA